jgi:hypothetical protein
VCACFTGCSNPLTNANGEGPLWPFTIQLICR